MTLRVRRCALVLILLLGQVTGEVTAAGARPAEAASGPAPKRPIDPASIDTLMRRGDEARRLGRIDAALSAYREALDLDPTHYDVRLVISDTLRRAGRAGRAIPEFEAALSLDPTRPEAYIGLARIHRGAFRFAEAESLLDRGRATVTGPGAHKLLVTLAETRRQAGRLDEAEVLFRRARLEVSASPRPLAGLALIAEQRGDLRQALAFWSRYLERKPEDEAATLRRQELAEIRASIEALREAAEKTPRAETLAELGRLRSIAGDHEGAIEAYRDAVDAEPRRADARRGLAIALREAGDDRGAVRAYRRLLRIVPNDATALYGLVEIARQSSDLQREERAWGDLMEGLPNDLFAVRAYLEFLQRAGRESEPMQRAIGRAILASKEGDSGPGSPAKLRRHAVVLAEAELWVEATETLYRALRIDPTDPWTLEMAGQLMFRRPSLIGELADKVRAEPAATDADLDRSESSRLLLLSRLVLWLGRGEEALDLARRATSIDEKSAMARSALAETEQRIRHDGERALEGWRQALEIAPARMTAHVDVALALLRLGRKEEAEETAREGLRRFPQAAPLLAILGAALSDQGELEEAAAAYAAARLADPADNFGLARGQYPRTLAALGRHVEARRALEGVLRPAPEMLYREAWAFARDSYRDRKFNGQDWNAWRDRYRGELSNLEEAYRAIAEMLASLKDPYTRLRRSEETAAVYLGRRSGEVLVDALGRIRPISRTVSAEELENGLGYIRLSNLSDPGAVAEVRQALLRMREKAGLVLDLRGNRGGLARTADAIGDLLIGPGVATGVDVGPDGEETQVTGGEGALTDGEIVVLVDGQTASAAERLARALETSGRGTLVGDRTFGKGRAQVSRVLPGGMTVLVSMAEMLGPDGRPLQGRGLRPRGRRSSQQQDPARAVPEREAGEGPPPSTSEE
jgi:tetratricopeptide (TPR) repeat protein